MSDNKSFDLIVIGGGTGGNGVARMAANAGWRVASIDSLPFGGTCALRGCDPKKMLIAVTEGVEWVRSLDGKGLEAKTAVNWPEMIAFKRTFTDAMPGRIEGGLEKAGVSVLHGDARFTGRDTIEVDGETLSAKHFHIATGARPMTLDIPGEELLATSTDFLELSERPDRAVFVGGGFIAMEFAHVAKRYHFPVFCVTLSGLFGRDVRVSRHLSLCAPVGAVVGVATQNTSCVPYAPHRRRSASGSNSKGLLEGEGSFREGTVHLRGIRYQSHQDSKVSSQEERWRREAIGECRVERLRAG